MSARLACWLTIAGVLGGAAPVRQMQQEIEDNPSTDGQDVVVNGRIPHCRSRLGDPMDAVDATQHGFARKQMVIFSDAKTGDLRYEKDRDPVTGPVSWQRAGSGLDQYVFRVLVNDHPLCMGARNGAPIGHAQLRRELDATRFHGKQVRFTAWIATRHVSGLRLWLATGDNGGVMVGEDNRAQLLEGNHGWTPVSFVLGPIPRCATKLSYGVILQGPGDVWMYHPTLETVKGKDATIAKAKDPHCRSSERARNAQ